MEANDVEPDFSSFRMQINMNLMRWQEFRWFATSFWQGVIRQVSVFEKETGTQVKGFQATLHKDHFSVHDGGGVVVKK